MSDQIFIAKAGTWGTTFGLRIPCEVRDSVFKRSWKTVQMLIDGKSVEINLPPSFWRKCNELKHPTIGNWLKSRGLDQWIRGNPPGFRVKHLGDSRFEILE